MNRQLSRCLCLTIALAAGPWSVAGAADGPAPAASHLDIFEYRVGGATHLSQLEVEGALSPFLGPGRTLDDVEQARRALEQAYTERGFLAVTVAIPPQRVREGVVLLEVTEGTIARLRVRGSRYFSLTQMKGLASSLAEGTTPRLADVSRDLVALNQLPDRRVTPELRAGTRPGTIDVELKVQDTLPLHGFLELDNRASVGTTPLRLTGWASYDNLWQAGHSLRLSFQVAPSRVSDALVFSGAYTARLPSSPWLSFSATLTAQNSDISTLGGIAVGGRGWLGGARALVTLPGFGRFFHTLSAGLDFKRFVERISLAEDSLTAVITYWPLTVQYGATLLGGDGSQTQLSATGTLNLRGLGSEDEDFDRKRYQASASFVHFRLELSHAQPLLLGLELVAKANGQVSSGPLIGAEQLIGGGAESVRGYLEGQAAGDFGGFVSAELRGPPFRPWGQQGASAPLEARLHLFAEGGWARLWAPLPEQQAIFRLWSAGVGGRLQLRQWLHGSLELAVPLRSEGPTERFTPRLLFRVWAEL